MGPRQMTGSSSSAKKPMEMARTPWDSGGTIMLSITVGDWSTPSILGMENPQTSASTTATDRPRWASATDRLVVTEDLPTPPLPDAISRTRVFDSGSANGMARPSACPWACWWPAVDEGSPCSFWRSTSRSSSVMTVKSTNASSIPSSATTAFFTRLSISARSGQPATVRAMRTLTVRSWMAMVRTMSRSTMLRCSSGSSTGRNASVISASVIAMGRRCSLLIDDRGNVELGGPGPAVCGAVRQTPRGPPTCRR